MAKRHKTECGFCDKGEYEFNGRLMDCPYCNGTGVAPSDDDDEMIWA